ncbi:MAG: pirin family protein [Burkholderiales bacterium]|jgi:redox-sensitive bicupin YhaK (pirin superfamily)|nr:pirin family protein [Burkholderiales bacterium]
MNSIATLLRGRATDLGGGLTVLRVLPNAAQRGVGPFLFVDHMGPADFAVGQGVDVRPHPHIGLGTITYLYDGALLHRDSLGTLQTIVPGDVNWMLAGHGIVHSERTPATTRALPHRLHGMQTWIALPEAHEDHAPAFEHHPAATLPQIERAGAVIRVIAGHAFGARAPVGVLSPLLYCSVELLAEAKFVVTSEHEERAIYVVAGSARIDAQQAERGTLVVLEPGLDVTVSAETASTLMLLGGAPVGTRHLNWNFVASTREKIDAARAEWARYGDAAARGRFGSVPGEHEFIPLPPTPGR